MKILFISLGCDKNLVDSEEMIGILSTGEYEFTDVENEADIVVVNTCCFINDAKEESISAILEMASLKKEGVCKALIVTGCMAQRYKQEILEEIPEVDALLGTASYLEIGNVIREVLSGKSVQIFKNTDLPIIGSDKRSLTTGGHFAYLKIAEGCDKCCTYCVIPQIRGPFRSVDIEELVKQGRELASRGVKELILVAQEVTLYGMDLYGKKMLPELLKELSKIEELQWIRLLYCYPEEITDDLIVTMKNHNKICNYIDMPIQHSEDEILKKMGRRTDKKQILAVIQKLRQQIPDIVIRTTLISGFPGESEDNHLQLVKFIEKMKFQRLGVFIYSKEEGTAASKLKPQITKKIKVKRRNEIMKVQQKISREYHESKIGDVLEVMIEGKLADEDVYVGRTYMDAPNVDGSIFVHGNEVLMSGDYVKVKVTGASEYDLIGELI